MNLPRNNFRRTTFIVDDPKKLAAFVTDYTESSRLLYVSQNPQKLSTNQTLKSVSPKEINRFLGQEFDCILFDANTDFDVNAFTAIVGTLVGGGQLVINLPTEIDPEIIQNQRFEQNEFLINPLLARFVQKIQSCKSKMDRSPLDAVDSFLIEQRQVIEKIKRCALGHAKRPLVITANRGRGKSACLGMAVADLATQNHKKIIITAPSKANVKILFQHVILQETNNYLVSQSAKNASDKSEDISKKIIFMPPDLLLKLTPEANLLIVDEAGAIPVQLLEKMLRHYNRVVFSTTIDGYEGNGRGFEIRFKSKLAKTFPQWRSASLKQPMRWPMNDPLEEAINDAFLLSCIQKSRLIVAPTKLEDVKFQLITKTTLYQDNNLLRQIYSLLVDAHYQTRPSDLNRILSDNSLLVFVALDKNQIVSTALISVEGNLSSEQCQAIERGKMRLPGHLLPQSLMEYNGDVQAGEYKFWRVMRIAVQSDWQRKKIATRLIRYIEEQATDASIDILGTSFALTKEVIQFWYQLNFKCSRLALRKDSSTGSYPGEFMRLMNGATSAAEKSFNAALSRFDASFYYSMTASYAEFEPAILLPIIVNQCHGEFKTLSQEIKSDISRYTEKARSFEMVEWQLNQLFIFSLTCTTIEPNLKNSEKHLLVAKLLQNRSWQDLIIEFDFQGKKQARERVREAIMQLINSIAPQSIAKN